MKRHRAASVVAGVWIVTIGASGILAQTPANFIAVPPCRIADTRNPTGPYGGPSMAGNTTRSFAIPSSSCSIPANASAYSVNLTLAPPGPVWVVELWPTGQAQPIVSTMNDPSGQLLANAAIVPAGTNGAVSVWVSNQTDIILDINGYFLPFTVPTSQSTALGMGASTVGFQNTAIGFNALAVNNTGTDNVANGALALSYNTIGNNNVGVGASALQMNSVGSANTAVGAQALLNNLIGADNTALGFNALEGNTAGINNTANGVAALLSNAGGSYNTALGMNALSTNVAGSSNIALGYQAGIQITGSNNIDIGNHGQTVDSNTIRIGDSVNQTSAYIAGIFGVTIPNGSSVMINSNGQLGTFSSSRRYKEDIRDMGPASDALMQLRPVAFRYRKPAADGTKPLQYGLIAEEVEKVFPELVLYGSNGQVESVQYHQLPALLLNELQKQRRTIEQQQAQIAQQQQQIHDFELRLSALENLGRQHAQ